MSSRLPVVAAIPNYNMGEQLEVLLPQLRQEDYADIFVLDDASTDGSRDIVEGLDLDVTFVASPENRGAAAARNLIIPALRYAATIHFVDADVDLKTERITEVIQDIMPTRPIGFIGGLALNPEGTQNIWNYGPRQCFSNDMRALIHERIGQFLHSDPEKAQQLREKYSAYLTEYPNPFETPTERPIFWNIEQNLLIQSEVFERMGGFDPSLREHEIQEIAIRMHQAGLERRFNPGIAIQHKAVDVRGYNRRVAQLKAEYAIHKKFGLRDYFMPDGKLFPPQEVA